MTELISRPENDTPKQAKLTIDNFETKLLEAGQPINAAQARVDALNFQSDATDHIVAKTELRDAKANYQPQIDELSAEWFAHGGARLDAARQAVEGLNFKSSAEDHIKAKTELRDAEDAWTKSYNNAQVKPPIASEPALDNPVENDTGDKADSKPEKDDSLVKEMIKNNARLSKLQAKANTLAKLKSSNGEGSDEFQKALRDWDEEIDKHREQDDYDSQEDAAIEYLNTQIANGEVIPVAEEPQDDAPDDEKLDTSGLDVEKKSIWAKYSQRAGDLYLKAATTFGQYMFALGSKIPEPKAKMGESPEDFEKRVSRYGVMKVLGVVAVVVAAKYGLSELNLHHPGAAHNSHRGASVAIAGVHDNGGMGSHEPVVESLLKPEFSPAAHTVNAGEGWYQTFKDMGITNATEQANLLNKVGPQLQEKGWAYHMPNGLWGISRPGQLPDDVLKLIQNSR